MKIILPLLSLMLTSAALGAQSCYEVALQKGQAAYNQGDYARAARFWTTGKECDDADVKKLNNLIWKTRDDDGDGFVNGKDKCPKAAYAKNGGCPPPKPKDTDEDGLKDEDDECPNHYGPKRFNGCPDKDGDEIPDKDDDCPADFGPKRTNGCPDKDGDGIRDKSDDCPAESGPAATRGCPDTDNDGVADKDDNCPKQAGPKSNAGCPLPPPSPTPSIPAGMVLVKGGTFTMGDQLGEGSSDEVPVHNVTLRDFYLGKYEVTFEEYDAFCSATGREKPDDRGWGRGLRPVIYVDWYDAVEYCNWRSQKENLGLYYNIDKNRKDPNNQNSNDNKKWTVTINVGAKGYRLPSEAEWEFAAREQGKKVRFGNGRDIIDPSEINFDASDSYKKPYSQTGVYRSKTVPVDELSANSLGLKHMSGNVWEWCADWYDSEYYKNSPAQNPQGPTSGSSRVLRGGSWVNSPVGCRVADRLRFDPNARFNFVGFRVARDY